MEPTATLLFFSATSVMGLFTLLLIRNGRRMRQNFELSIYWWVMVICAGLLTQLGCCLLTVSLFPPS